MLSPIILKKTVTVGIERAETERKGNTCTESQKKKC